MKAGLIRAWQALLRLYPMGISLLWKAPLVLALVMVPEFLQHVVEIQLGMFGSRDAARAAANDPTRWAFGYAKIAGLVLTFLAAARYWWARAQGGRWWDLRAVAWGRLLLGAVLFLGIPLLPDLFKAQLDPRLYQALLWGLTLGMLPALFLILAGLLGDRTTTIRAMWRRSWPWAFLTALLVVLAFAPAQWLHGMNHRMALGADPVVVWALMIFDLVLVGWLAGLTGTALYLGYAAFRDSASPIPNRGSLSTDA